MLKRQVFSEYLISDGFKLYSSGVVIENGKFIVQDRWIADNNETIIFYSLESCVFGSIRIGFGLSCDQKSEKYLKSYTFSRLISHPNFYNPDIGYTYINVSDMIEIIRNKKIETLCQ